MTEQPLFDSFILQVIAPLIVAAVVGLIGGGSERWRFRKEMDELREENRRLRESWEKALEAKQALEREMLRRSAK